MNTLDRIRALLSRDGRLRTGFVYGVTALTCAMLLTDFRGLSGAELREGDIADHDIVAPMTVPFVDTAATAEHQREAEQKVAPVFEADLTLGKRIENRIAQAFDLARRRLEQAHLEHPGRRELPPDVKKAIDDDFLQALEVPLTAAEVEALHQAGFAPTIEELSLELLGVGMRRYVMADKSALPNPARPVQVREGDQEETTLEDYSQIRTPEEARQAVSLYVIERLSGARSSDGVAVAGAIARGAIKPNFSYNALITEERRRQARETVGQVNVEIKRGSRVVASGDTVSARQAVLLAKMRDADQRAGRGLRFATWLVFVGALIGTAANFARSTVRKFSTKAQDLEAMAFALVLTLGIGRLIVSSGTFLDRADTDGTGLALLTPVAGGAMLVRILINSESALVWTLVAAILASAQTDQTTMLAAYYLVTGLVAATAVGQARERLSVLRAGITGGAVGAAFALTALVLRAQSLDLAGFSWSRVASDTLLSFGAGALSAVLALGIAPAFELLGFVTDAKLLELSNLNHPLLRQLMLRAPGTYHHSVIVGSLSEAACETIGANALLARVACYFHDIGKGLKPQYFVENQRDGQNRHDRLSPAQSAAMIINHVREGAALAQQYKLPRPIYDNIFMHHGTGLIQYFYSRAQAEAGGEKVDEALFRYPGPKPNSREAGIIMLADKVEAACRTIQNPTEDRLRAMIQSIINNVMSDGQFEDCPLTLRELYQIGDTFTAVLMGIYHHRIEYPGTAAISSGKGRYAPVPRQGTITLEIINPLKSPPEPRTPVGDYEAVDPDPTPPRLDVDDS